MVDLARYEELGQRIKDLQAERDKLFVEIEKKWFMWGRFCSMYSQLERDKEKYLVRMLKNGEPHSI